MNDFCGEIKGRTSHRIKTDILRMSSRESSLLLRASMKRRDIKRGCLLLTDAAITTDTQRLFCLHHSSTDPKKDSSGTVIRVRFLACHRRVEEFISTPETCSNAAAAVQHQSWIRRPPIVRPLFFTSEEVNEEEEKEEQGAVMM